MADAFAASERMVLAIPPEGTRSAVREWKSGFYHIAVAAGVPIVLSVLGLNLMGDGLRDLMDPKLARRR